MRKLKNILQFKYLFLIITIGVIFISLIRVEIRKGKVNNIEIGILEDIKTDGNKVSFIINSKEKIKCTYYAKTEKELNEIKKLYLGIKIKVNGIVNTPSSNTIPNTFNYQKYLKSKNIYQVINVSKIEVIDNDINILYKIKNYIINRIAKFKSKRYLSAFILGDKTYLDDEIKNMYQELGVSHIFAISGMHISLITSILFFLLKKFNEKLKYLIVIVFLIIYVFLTGFAASVLRSVAFFIISYINRQWDFNLSVNDVFYIAISLLLIVFPNLIYDIGFIYSSTISFSLIRFSYLIKGSYIKSSLIISTISFLVSLPITINNNFEINILSIINNLFIVPYISFILFPLSLLTFFIPYLDNLMCLLSNFVELFSKYLLIFNIIIPKMNYLFISLYYICLYIFFSTYKKGYLIVILCILSINKYYPLLDNHYYIYYLDVSQGDSSLIKYRKETVLIDTGGSVSFKEEEWQKKKEYHLTATSITFLKSIGVTHLNYLLLTHGDADHLGDSLYLIENFKVDKIILNNGSYNEYEKKLMKYKDKITKEYNSKIDIKFLNETIYDNENDNSLICYLNIEGNNYLFMGDASIKKEKELLNKYQLNNVVILKVGHHGSKTSSSKEFINNVNPKYSIISVGKNNRYGHPNDEVLENLEKSIIYRTDSDGSIRFKIKNNKLKIKTYPSIEN